MADLVNMALPKPKKGEKDTASVPCCGKAEDRPKYPWGLEVRLDGDAIKKLGLNIKDFDTDTIVQIQAKAETTSVSESDTQQVGKSVSLAFQITDMALTCEGEDGFQKGWDGAQKGKDAVKKPGKDKGDA